MLRLIALVLLAGCGGAPATSIPAQPSTQAPPTFAPSFEPGTPSGIASDYAYTQSDEMLGCSTAAPGRESEQDPGCIWSVAFAGCLDGLTGQQTGPVTIEEEFPTEPALVARYYEAVEHCAGLR